MKQILQNFKTGELTVEEVPVPSVRPGLVRVRNRYSLISSGTEGGTVKLGEMNLLRKARARPEQVRKVLNVVRTDGLLMAYQAVMRSLGMPIALGYCCCGQVLDAGAGITDLRPGQLVACGGAGYAHHAEVVCVPRNLVVAVPEAISAPHAAFTTLGSIAIQSVRIADVRLGERVAVIGLGLVGLLVVQILKAAGCRIFGIDLNEARVRFAEDQGFCQGAVRDAGNLREQVHAFSAGHGADAVIVAAATADNDPVRLAGELARTKGRVVVVGRTRMNAPRETYLFKELELCTSMAYGPGTGDPSYEEQGLDYPIGYVRWTENRNMQAFIELIASGAIDLDPLITHEFEIADACQAFGVVTGKTAEPSLGVVLRYPDGGGEPAPRVELPGRGRARRDELRLSVVGAGSFATNFLVPILAKTSGIALRGIASASGVRARALGKQYKFRFCASDAEELVRDDQTDGVAILTRHDSHAPLTLAALEAGKHVFVEKPLAMTVDELRRIVETQRRTGGAVQVGFNRRFAPLALKMQAFFRDRAQPMAITYRSNVGYRPPEHWLHDPIRGGGVILGEAVHFIDFCHWLIGADPLEVRTRSVRGEATGLINADNVHISLSFADGSLATVAYLSNGDPSLSRERIEAYADGGVAVLEDFRALTCVRNRRRRRWRRIQDRGHAGQMAAMVRAWRLGEPEIPFAVSALSMLATLEAVASLESAKTRPIGRDAIGL